MLLKLKEEDTSVRILVKEELYESVVEIRRRSNRMIAMSLTSLIFEEKMIQVICVYVPQSGKPDVQKDIFYDKVLHEWDMKRYKRIDFGEWSCWKKN